MPAPLVVGLVALYQALAGYVISLASVRGMAWLAANAAVTGLSLGRPEDYQAFKRAVYEFGAAKAMDYAGLELNEEDPFSDQSLCEAIGKRSGVNLRTLKKRESIREDVERWALATLEEKTGLHIRNVHDKEGVVKDVVKFASPIVADNTGLPLTDISNADTTKREITNYLKDRALVVLAQDVAKAKAVVGEALKSMGTGLQELADEVMKRGGIDPVTGLPNVRVDATMVALGILSNALVKADKRRRLEEMEVQKASRRREQVRAAVKRFREKHGPRVYYERVT